LRRAEAAGLVVDRGAVYELSVTITETAGNSSIVGSVTNPAPRQISWNATTATVTVVPGDISTQTIAIITDGVRNPVIPGVGIWPVQILPQFDL